MDNRAALGSIVIVALAGVFFLFGGSDLFSGGGSGPSDPGAADSRTLDADGPDAGKDAPEHDVPSKGPVLFGRPRAERVGQGGLTGRVMDFETGKPLENAAVILAGRGFGDESVGLSGSTDPSGSFRFQDVAAGEGYTLSVSDEMKRTRTMPSVGVDAGREKDVGVLWMGQAGELVGVVLDAAGLPLAGAEVQVHAGGGSMMELLRNMTKLLEVLDQDAQPIARATSERTGRFAVADLPPGPYTLVIRATGFQLATRKVVMTQAGAAGGKVTVRLGAGAPITGIVVDDRGRAVEGARVAVLEKNEMQSVFFGRQFSYTDSGGSFRIESPPTQGSYAVIVAAEGYPTLFTEASAGDGDLRFVLMSGTEVILRVLEMKTERPVEGAHLMGMFSKTISASGNKMSFASGVTDHRGEATLLASPGKLQMMFFSHEARGNTMFNPMIASMMGVGGILEGPKDTTIKGRSTTLVFHLKVGVTVRGKVTGPAGKPIVGARISTLGMMGMGGSTTTDGEGLYEMQNQSMPISAVLVAASGFVQERSVSGGFGGLHKPDENGEITIDVKMQAAASVAGRVVDAKGKPLAGVEVKIGGGGGLGDLTMLTGGARATITNAAGRYVLGGVGPAKDLHVMGHLQGRIDSKTTGFEVTEGVVAAPDLVMHTGSKIKVRVEGPDGAALSGARIEVNVQATSRVNWDPMGGLRGLDSRLTTASGRSEIEDVPDGTVTLTATKKGYAAARVGLSVAREDKTSYETTLQLGQAATLEGTVVDTDGHGIEGAVVQTLSDSDVVADGSKDTTFVPRVSDTTDEQGRFELKGLPRIRVRLAVTAEGYKPTERPVESSDGATQIRLVKRGPGRAKRLEAVKKELLEIYGKIGSVKDEAERTALTARMLQLQKEQRTLETPLK